MTKKEEGFHKLPKECRFLTQSGDIKVVKENGFYAYEFILRSNLGGAEYLYFTPVDKPPYEKGDLYYEDHEIMKLKDNWYFVGSY